MRFLSVDSFFQGSGNEQNKCGLGVGRGRLFRLDLSGVHAVCERIVLFSQGMAMKTTTTIGLLTGLFASAVPVVHAVNDEAIAHAGKCMTCHGGSDE